MKVVKSATENCKVINDKSSFDTKTEEAFYNFMCRNGVNCTKIAETKKDPVPDFLCELNGYKAIFELKDLNESGTAKWQGSSIVSQSITITGAVSRFIGKCSKKFLNVDYKKFDSALVVTNLRWPNKFEDTTLPRIEKAIKDNFVKHPEIGNLIIAGYNEPGNQILAFHIFENKISKRKIEVDFFKNFNHKYIKVL